jgi:hypothetical protein
MTPLAAGYRQRTGTKSALPDRAEPAEFLMHESKIYGLWLEN